MGANRPGGETSKGRNVQGAKSWWRNVQGRTDKGAKRPEIVQTPISCDGSYRSGKTGKSQAFKWSGKGQGKYFFWKSRGKVRENENVPVIERLIELLPSLKKYVKSVGDRKLTNPGTKSFETVRAGCLDSLIEVKLHFALFQKLIVMSSCSSLLTSFTLPQRMNWKTVVENDRLDTFLQNRMAVHYPTV